MKNNISSYIKKRSRLLENQNLSFFGSISVFVKDPLPEDISLRIVLRRIENLIPHYLVNNIDAVYVGQFDEFVEMDKNAAYKDGALYITNDQHDEDDMIDDIVHEIAHAVYGTQHDESCPLMCSALNEDAVLNKEDCLKHLLKHQPKEKRV